MTLTLDPRRPVLWRTPDSLQVGLDDPPVMLSSVAVGHERMLAGLAVGVTRGGLALLGHEAGLTSEEIEQFFHRIQPALLAAPVLSPASIEIDGAGPTADKMMRRLREVGIAVGRNAAGHNGVGQNIAGNNAAGWNTAGRIAVTPHADAAAQGSPDTEGAKANHFAVIFGNYVLEPERRGRWLRRDIPHLPVVYSDVSVALGPFIEPGYGPCLYCLELHRRDTDESWPALASQLLGKSSSAQTPFVASETAVLATRILYQRIRNGAARTAVSVTLNTESGELSRREWHAHPECACSGMPEVSASVRREIATANFAPVAGRSRQTTRDEAAREPA